MNNHISRSILILAAACVPSGVLAQDVDEEVRKAAQAAVASAVSQAISDTVVSGIPGTTGAPSSSVVWTRPSFTHLSVDSTDADIFLAPAGAVYRVDERLLINANVSFGYVSIDNGSSSVPVPGPIPGPAPAQMVSGFDDSIELLGFGAGVSYVVHKDETTAAWIDLLGLYNHTFLDNINDTDTLTLAPAVTVSKVAGPVLIEPSVSLPVTFDLTEDAEDDLTASVGGGLRIAKSQGPIIPEVKVEILRSLEDDADGFDFRVTPEINYETGEFTIGVGYSYSTILGDDDIDLDGHAGLLNFQLKL